MNPISSAHFGEAGFQACEHTVLTDGGYGYANESHVERYLREVMISRLAPISLQPSSHLGHAIAGRFRSLIKLALVCA
jgi:alkylation response protein AidB-like acyl-CoA dehydrogenase